jgi:hypothetical protein
MADAEVRVIGIKEIRAAIKRNPRKVREEGGKFLVRAMAKYKSGIINNPWTVNSKGGGAPVDTHNLRDTHKTQIQGLTGIIGPDEQAAPYAKYVHGNKKTPVKVKGTRNFKTRPWLDYVYKQKDAEVEELYRDMLSVITKDLAA